ncbi:MAG: T9SS type A sorting domain-containing protein [Bacteroidota bacterium]|nr:T9SS type A sorting domain-containing protein [Bacteroidota bacterium]
MITELFAQHGLLGADEMSGVQTGSHVVSGSAGFRYKDTLALTMEFNTTLNFDKGWPKHHVIANNGEVTVHGLTNDPSLPVRNAVQNSFGGYVSVFVVGFDSTGRDLRYCTYLHGGSAANIGIQGAAVMSNYERTMVAGDDGDVYGTMLARKGAPLTANAFQDYPELTGSKHNSGDSAWTGYVYRLERSGRLTGATYLGGPGSLYGVDMAVSDSGVYITGVNFFDSLQTTPGTLIPSKPDPYCDAAVLLRLTRDLDSLVFMTNMIVQNRPVHTLRGMQRSGDFSIDTNGDMVVCYTVNRKDMAELILPGKDPAYYDGYWYARISSDGRKVLSSRLITNDDIPGELYPSSAFYSGVDHIFVRNDGGVDLFGGSVNSGNPVSLPAKWTSEPVFDAVHPDWQSRQAYPLWGMTLSEKDVLRTGKYFGLSGLGVAGTGHFVTPDRTCGGYYHFHENYRHYDSLFTVDPVSSSRDGRQERFIINLDEDLNVRYATEWNAAYMPSRKINPVLVDHHGYCYIAPRYDNTVDDCRFFRSWRTIATTGDDTYLARFRIHTPCWLVGCAISAVDTIGIERRRGYANPSEFTVNYVVTNHSGAKGAEIVHAMIELPQGFELVTGTPQQSMSPATLSAGMTATCSWRIRVSDPALLIASGTPDTVLVRCRVFYVDPESRQSWPMGEELCEADIAVVLYDEPEPEMVCTVDGADRLYWIDKGYAESRAGQVGAVRYTFTLTNLEQDTVAIDAFRCRAGPHCKVIGDTIRPGLRLAPGASHMDAIDVEVGGLRYDRAITVEAAALDTWGVPQRFCSAETMVPGTMDMTCVASGTEKVTWNTATGMSSPETIACLLLLENPLDTIRRDVLAWADLSAAPHLSAATGDSLPRPSFSIAPEFKRALNWTFSIATPPETRATDTVVFMYESDGIVRSCVHTVEIQVLDEDVTCTLVGPDTLDATKIRTGIPVSLQYTLLNTGTVAVEVDRYELVITSIAGSGRTGLVSLDPLSRTGGTLVSGKSIALKWALRPLILRESRHVVCTVTAFDAHDSVLSVCSQEIFLQGLDGLICTLSAVDTVRFIRAELRYDPDTIVAAFTLENLLDSEETSIEAHIDLAQASRLVLAASESMSRTVAVIDSQATATLTWQLIPLYAPTGDDQQITIRYRSAQMTEWRKCASVIHIEAWPEETDIACVTGGHDSLYADPHYERYIPDPLFVSYTVTNTGTVALTGCEASIALPAEFVLAGSDSTQVFTSPEFGNQPGGPVPPGTLLPNATCTRWWMIAPTDRLASSGPLPISWIWNDDQQGGREGCSSTIEVIPDSPGSIVLSPLHLYFEAERGGPLPAVQHVQLWTGGGFSMPWMVQPSAWWLDSQSASGTQTSHVAVQPNSTVLDVGAHDVELLFASAQTQHPVAVTYVLHKSTGFSSPMVSCSITLDVWPQPVYAGGRFRIRIDGKAGERYRLALYDLLGRKYAEMLTIAGRIATIDASVPRLPPGVYLLRAISADGAQATRLISVAAAK